MARLKPVTGASCRKVNRLGIPSQQGAPGAIQWTGLCALATIKIPTNDTPNPKAMAHDKGSLNTAQAHIMVTGGLTYSTAVTRAGEDFRSAM